MNSPPELDVRVSLEQLSQLSADGQVYRAYAHAIVSVRGVVVMVPIALVDGDLTMIVDYCPVSWQEAIAIVEDEGRGRRAVPAEHSRLFGVPFRQLAPANWDVDEVELAPGARAARLTHPTGIRIAAAVPRILESIDEVFRV